MSSEIVNLLIPVLIALAVASRGFRVDDQYVREWATSAGVALDETTWPLVRRSLALSRRARTVGGLVGFLSPVLYERFTSFKGGTGGWSLLLMFVGYLLGALVAELVLNRPRRGDGPALLVPRRLEDYLPGYVRTLQRGLGLLSMAGAATYAILYAVLDGAPYRVAPSPLEVAGFGLGGACIALITEMLQRSIVGRRQVVASDDRRAVDDAMRSWSLHVLAAAGIALLFIFAGGQLGVITALAGTVGSFVGVFIILFTTVAAFAFWRDLSRPHGFRVRRGVRTRAHA
jgi:hypothetical protein